MFHASDKHTKARRKWLTSPCTSRGFTLVELMVAMGLGLVVLSGALALTSQAVGISDMVTQRSEMQQNGRIAINLLVRDLSLAGTGFPTDGVQLPSGVGSQDSYFACDSSGCYITNNAYSQERLFAVTPGDGKGPTINGLATDIVTLVYNDTNSKFDQYLLTDIQDDGEKIWFDSNTTPAYDDPVVGLAAGDVLLFSNSNGVAVGQVTAVLANGEVRLNPNDNLNFNQSGAGLGNIKSMIYPPGPPEFAPTYARRINIITYYIDDSDPDSPMLMHQVSAHPPIPVAENIEGLQMTYDIFDDVTEINTADLPDAGSVPTRVRKINIALTTRSPVETMVGRDFQRISLTTSVGPRNLTFRDRYQ